MSLNLSQLAWASVAVFAWLLVPRPVGAQMIPIRDERIDHVQAQYQGVLDTMTSWPGTPFGYWDDYLYGLAEKYEPCENPPPDSCLVGSAESFAFQISEFWPAGIQISGGGSGGWGIPPSGDYSWVSNAGFTFRVDSTVAYTLTMQIDRGDWALPGDPDGIVRLLAGSSPRYEVHAIQSGVLVVGGRLGPGVYTLEGWSSGGTYYEHHDGATYFAQWLVHSVIPIIDDQPEDVRLPCGESAVLTVGTAGPSSGYTFQWRHNGIPLTNGGNVSGATSNALVLHAICVADTGGYDVVVTGIPPGGGSPPGSPVSEPSRLAHVSIGTGTTGVGADPVDGPPTALLVRAAAPNPFRQATTIAYEAPSAGRLRATVYDVAGAAVCTIADREVDASGVVTWDGRQNSGVRAPAGLYFIRLDVDGVRVTRKVVLAE